MARPAGSCGYRWATEASVTRYLGPNSSCQSQFIAYLVLSFESHLISQRTHAESDLAPDGLLKTCFERVFCSLIRRLNRTATKLRPDHHLLAKGERHEYHE
jgi:hypothetical protein